MNVGTVVYKKDFETGKMEASWNYAAENKVHSGTGKATGEPGDQYSGEYIITYYDSAGENPDTNKLIIKEEQNYYLLEWFKNGKLSASGVGMLEGNSLVAGWEK